MDLDLPQIAQIWRYGSVVRSWLLDLTADALAENPELKGLEPYVEDSGEGRWTVFEAINLDVAAPVITESLLRRIRSREEYNFTDRMLAIMRNRVRRPCCEEGRRSGSVTATGQALTGRRGNAWQPQKSESAPEDVKQAASQVEERIPEPGVVVIFGASGDLTKRKLLPALFHLEQSGLLPQHFRIVGVARRDLGNAFANDMREGILEFGGSTRATRSSMSSRARSVITP